MFQTAVSATRHFLCDTPPNSFHFFIASELPHTDFVEPVVSRRGCVSVYATFRPSSVLLAKSAMNEIEDDASKNTSSLRRKRVPSNVIALGGGALALFSGVSWMLQKEYASASIDMYSDTIMIDTAQFFLDHPIETLLLMVTHAIPFALIPVTMRFVEDKESEIQKLHPEFSAFIMNLGLATISFGLAMEFGWHVTTQWYYEGGYQILNFCFYFFAISGFALWADGFKSNKIMDTIFGLILLAATILYSMGEDGGSKVPLYIGMTVTFGAITVRGMEIFDRKMLWVPFFSVLVNLGFIFFGLEPVSDPAEGLSSLNYIYHTCHDLFGTELGVAVFAYFMATYNAEDDPSNPNNLLLKEESKE